MKSKRPTRRRSTTSLCLLLLAISLLPATVPRASAESNPAERIFLQSLVKVEKALKGLQAVTAGRLPILDGFALPGDRQLDRFHRGYYQCTVKVEPTASGATRVLVSAKITAWYTDPVSSRSGYLVLLSNGRLEADLLDQLQESLEGKSSSGTNSTAPSTTKPARATDVSEPTLSAPMPRIPAAALQETLAAPLPAGGQPPSSLRMQTDTAEKHEQELAAEAKGLEEILQNQAHPSNLAAVKQNGTPVLQNSSANAALLFSATAGDEFEILDVTSGWVHVRISGLSRGWIRRSAVEMPEEYANANDRSAALGSEPVAALPFHVANEQFAPFPGDWAPLRGKIVKIVSVQKTSDGDAKNSGSRAKLEFTKALFDKEYAGLATTAEGIVLIFDSEDGGMVAATLSVLQQWKAGSLTEDAMWRQCFFDPPEILSSVSGQ